MPAPVVHLHIGAMKTGTTYLQKVMSTHADALEAAGMHFGGGSWSRQVRAAQELLGLDQHDPQIAALSAGAWQALVEDLHQPREATSVVSMEFLSFARRRAVSRLARDFAGIDWHVVITVRDATAVIPAQWQTSITSGATHDWPSFQSGVRDSGRLLWLARALRDSAVREFRRTQDVPHMLAMWGRHVPPERLHVVLVPGRGAEPDELWRRFASVVGVDPAVVDAHDAPSNASLGHASTELIRRLNVELGGEVLPWDYNRTVKAPLGTRILGPRRAEEGRPALDAETAAFAREWNRRTRAAIASSGCRVVGDLDVDLPVQAPASGARGGGGVAQPSADDVLAAARTAHAGLVAVIEKRRHKVARLMEANPPVPTAPLEPQWLTRPGGGSPDLDGAVHDLADLARTAIHLRRNVLELEHRPGSSDGSGGSGGSGSRDDDAD